MTRWTLCGSFLMLLLPLHTLRAQWTTETESMATPVDTLPAFFSRIAYFQISAGFPASGSGQALETQLQNAGFTRTGYNYGTGRNMSYPRTTGSGWLQFDVGARFSDKFSPGIQFGTSNNQTAQGNMDSSAFPQLMVLKLSQVYAVPYLRFSRGRGLLQYKLGLGLHRVQFSTPVAGVQNRGKERSTRLGFMAGAGLRVYSRGNTALRFVTELHLVSAVQAGPLSLSPGLAGNPNELTFPRFTLPLSHANIGLRLEFGQP